MNAQDFTAKLGALKKTYDQAKEDRLRAEQDLANSQKRLEELEGKCREFGVEPDQLGRHIAETTELLESAIKEIEAAIPPEYLTGAAPGVSAASFAGAGRLRPDLTGGAYR